MSTVYSELLVIKLDLLVKPRRHNCWSHHPVQLSGSILLRVWCLWCKDVTSQRLWRHSEETASITDEARVPDPLWGRKAGDHSDQSSNLWFFLRILRLFPWYYVLDWVRWVGDWCCVWCLRILNKQTERRDVDFKNVCYQFILLQRGGFSTYIDWE